MAGVMMRGDWTVGAIAMGFSAARVLVSLTFASFYSLLARRSWRAYDEYRHLIGEVGDRPEPMRRYIGIGAMAISIVLACLAFGVSVVQNYRIGLAGPELANAIVVNARSARSTDPKRPGEILERQRTLVSTANTRSARSADPKGPGEILERQRTLVSTAETMSLINARSPAFEKTLAQARNNLAWQLATSADPSLRKPEEAVTLARKAIENSPQEANYHNTLGAALYAAGDWDGAAAALTKSIALNKDGGTASDFYFLAMAHARRGDLAVAREWFDKAVRWTSANKPNDPQLIRFRDEAKALLATEPATKSP
jgi:tetratricopeptide (TPR) repeat protein